MTDQNITDAIELAKKCFPKDNHELILKLFEESCTLGTKKEELLKDNIESPRYWVAVNDNKVLGFSGYYFDPNEKDAVWAGWAAVDLSLGMLAARVASNLFTKVAYEARKTGRKYIRLYVSTLPEEAMANRIYDKYGFIVYKTGIDWDGAELLYKQAEAETVYEKFQKNG